MVRTAENKNGGEVSGPQTRRVEGSMKSAKTASSTQRAGPVISKSKANGGRVIKNSTPKGSTVGAKSGKKAGAKKATKRRKSVPKAVEEEYDPDQEYEVERIIGCKYVGCTNDYLVLWKGYKDPTWEPEENLKRNKDLINDFVESLRSNTAN